jgi:hypothetical protein
VSDGEPRPEGRLAALLLRGGRRRQLLAIVFGLGALLAAILALAWNRETVSTSLASLKQASPLDAIALAASCAGQLALSAFVFWWLYRLRVRVPAPDMAALVAASNAANFLPLRPGLVGRVAYLRVRHGVTLPVSVRVTLEAAGLTAVVTLFLIIFLPLGDRAGLPVTAGGAVFAILAGIAAVFRPIRPHAIASLARLAELGLLAFRYWIAFALIGERIDAEAAIAFACIASAASMVPLVPNGMGLREWAIGLLAPFIAGHTLQEGIAAELVNRAAELLVTVPVGGIAAAWLARRPRPLSPS